MPCVAVKVDLSGYGVSAWASVRWTEDEGAIVRQTLSAEYALLSRMERAKGVLLTRLEDEEACEGVRVLSSYSAVRKGVEDMAEAEQGEEGKAGAYKGSNGQGAMANREVEHRIRQPQPTNDATRTPAD
jgi:hypothetical protein